MKQLFFESMSTTTSMACEKMFKSPKNRWGEKGRKDHYK